MIDYIVSFFTEGDWLNILGKVLQVFLIALFVYVSIHYSRKRNLIWLIYIEAFAVLVLFSMSFANVAGYSYYVLFVLIGMVVANFSLFSNYMSRDLFRRSWRVGNIKIADEFGREELHQAVEHVVRACQNLSKSDTGALILIADNINDAIIDSGTRLSADVTSDLIETIFFPKTNLHDGALVITANKIISAGCYLPLTQELDLPREFGTRHRAAMGITEGSPNITAIVVSEETGIISAMHDGKIKRYLDADTLRKILELAFRLVAEENFERVWGGKSSL